MNKSTLLTIIGGIGVVATAVIAVRATPKAMCLIEQAKEEKGENLTKFEIVKTTALTYLPVAITGVATIGCIFGANILNTRQQASMTSAYALLDRSYREYRKKVSELYGDESNRLVLEEIAREEYESEPELCFRHCTDGSNGDEQLFFHMNTMRYFEARPEDVFQSVITEDGLECTIIATPF